LIEDGGANSIEANLGIQKIVRADAREMNNLNFQRRTVLHDIHGQMPVLKFPRVYSAGHLKPLTVHDAE